MEISTISISFLCKILFLLLYPAVVIHIKAFYEEITHKEDKWSFLGWFHLLFIGSVLASDIAFGLYLLLYVRDVHDIILPQLQ